MTQDVDIQLQVWKDLAISKQILMGAATDALGLDSECSTAELKSALDAAIKRAREADASIIETRETAEQQVAEMKQQLKLATQARDEAVARVDIAEQARESAEHQLTAGKSDNAEALKKARAEVADKQNKLKAISKSLADTPENVVKKLKTLKKQKMDEAKLRAQGESKIQSLRKEKTKLEAKIETQKTTLENSASLVDQLRELHKLCKQANKTIKKLSDSKDDLLVVPKLDEEALEALEQVKAK